MLRKWWGVVAIILGAAILVVFASNVKATAPGTNILASVNYSGDGQGGNGNSDFNTMYPLISADGRFVAFDSVATNLVPGDTNGLRDIFVRDLDHNTTSLVSMSSSGVQQNGDVGTLSGAPKEAISSNGRYVAYASNATNLIDGQTITTPVAQLYLRDTLLNTTSLVTQTGAGVIGNGDIQGIYGVSDDGRFVAWVGAENSNLDPDDSPSSTGWHHVYLADLQTRAFKLLNSMPGVGSYVVDNGGSMSCDGSLITFSTNAPIDPGDTDTASDVYLIDIRNGLKKINITSSTTASRSSYAPSISCNGEYIAFTSTDYELSPLLSSADYLPHTYLYDRINNRVSIVDTSTSGVVANSNSLAHPSVDNRGDVAFASGNSSNLIDGQTIYKGQVYLKHHDTGVVEIVTRTPSGEPSNGSGGYGTTISADGKKVAHLTTTSATDLLGSDTNGKTDVLVSLTGL